MRLSIILCILLSFSACKVSEMLKEQKSYLEGISIVEENEYIKLKRTVNISHERNGTKSMCTLWSGSLKKIWQSNSIDFYLTISDRMNCDGYEIGGIAYDRNKDIYFTWIYPVLNRSREKWLAKFSEPKFVAGFNNNTSIRPVLNPKDLINPQYIER